MHKRFNKKFIKESKLCNLQNIRGVFKFSNLFITTSVTPN